MGWDQVDETAKRQAWFESSWRVEELTAECMAGKGIEYTAWLPPDFYIGEAPIYEEGHCRSCCSPVLSFSWSLV